MLSRVLSQNSPLSQNNDRALLNYDPIKYGKVMTTRTVFHTHAPYYLTIFDWVNLGV